MKKASVVIPAYNMADFTVRTIESVLSQTYKNIEIIVVDDGSTDNTRERLEPYRGRINYIYKENGGACSARNLGIKLAKGEYLALLDCDDLYLPKKIELSVDFLEKNPSFGFVYTAAYYVDDKDSILRKFSHHKSRRAGWIAKILLLRNYICNSTVVVRKDCFDKIGFFDETIFTSADWDMWLRLAEHYKAGYINIPLSLYRFTDSYIFKNIELAKNEELAVLEKAFQRNLKITARFRDRAVSNVYRRCAVNYLLTNNYLKAKKELIISIDKNKLNVTSILLLMYFLLARRNLQFLVKKKVFCNFGF